MEEKNQNHHFSRSDNLFGMSLGRSLQENFQIRFFPL